MTASADNGLNWQVMGHAWAVSALARGIAVDHSAHAYLFTGPHGIGKTTLARVFAQAMECTGEPRPCGQCVACQKISRDRHPDVQIIEGVPVGWKFDEKMSPPPRKTEAERRILKIDQIRAIQHDVSRAPFEGRWRVVILRRFEEANEEAANAFLKTLEEPPSQTRLVLTARDASLLLPTIASRCQVFALRPLAIAAVESALVNRWKVDATQARLLAHLSSGRLGWAVRASTDASLLDARRQQIEQLEAALNEGRTERLVRAEALAKNSDALPDVIEQWMGWWRDVLLMQNGEANRITNVDHEARIREHAARFPLPVIQRALQSLRTTARYLSQNVNARLATEVLLLNLPGNS